MLIGGVETEYVADSESGSDEDCEMLGQSGARVPGAQQQRTEGKMVISSALYHCYSNRRTEMANREMKFSSMANRERNLSQWQIGKHYKF